MQKLKELFQGANKERNIMILSGLLILVIISAVYLARPDNKLVTDSPEPDILMERIHEKVSNLAYPFVENKGQINNGEAVRFYAPTMAGTMYVTDNEITYAIEVEKENIEDVVTPDMDRTEKLKKISENKVVYAIREKMTNSEGETIDFNINPEQQSETKVSYYIGSSTEDWKQGISTYKYLSLGNIWNNTEVKVRAQGNNIEKLFIVNDGGNPDDINLVMDGIEKLAVRDNGELSIQLKDGEIRMTNPVAYQYDDNDKKVYVPVKYAINDDEKSYGFEVNKDIYDPRRELVIDPLLASTFIGGSADERETSDPISRNVYTGHYAIVDDMNGDVYVIGHTQSSDYPTTAGAYDETYNDGISPLKNDVVISKFNADLTELLASTYFGGISEDTGAAIDLYNDKIYVAGYTTSDESSFPITANAPEKLFMGGGYDGFVAKFDKELISLEESTYFPGNSIDYIYSLTVDQSTGDVYIGGSTNSTYLPNTVNSNTGSDYEAFVAKLNSGLTSITATRFIGGTNDDYGRMIKLNNDNIILVGKTNSTDFATSTGCYQGSLSGSFDAFVVVMPNTLDSITYSTYLGGSYAEDEFSIDVLANNNIVVAGQTKSGDFPTTTGAYSTIHNTGNYDGFISILNPTLTTLVASTFLGGNYLDEIYELKVDGNDWIYVGGYTNSTNFPSNNTMSGTADGFIARINQNLTATDFTSTFLGGAGALDYVLSLDTTIDNQLMVFGITNSVDFPTTNNAYDETYNGGRDMYLAKMTKDLSVDQTPSHVKITKDSDNSSLMTATAGATTTQIRISIMDIYNIPIYVEHGERTVRLSGPADAPDANPSHKPKCQDKDGVFQEVGSYMTLDFNRGTSTTECLFYAKEIATMEGYASTTDALTIDSTGNTSHSLTVNVSANSNVSSAFSKIDAAIDPILAGQTETITLTTYDIYKNAMGTNDSGQTVNIYVNGANDHDFLNVPNVSGVYTRTYAYTNLGTDEITATVNGSNAGSDTDPSATDPYDGDNGTRHVTAIDHLLLSLNVNPSIPIIAGGNYTIKVTAVNNAGQKVVGYTGNKNIVFSVTEGSAVSPNGSIPTCAGINFGSNTNLTFTNGEASCAFVPKQGGSISVDAADGTLSTAAGSAWGLDLTILHGANSYLKVTGSKNSQVAGESQLITVTVYDLYGNQASTFNKNDQNIVFSGITSSYGGAHPKCTENNGAYDFMDNSNPIKVDFINGAAITTCVLYARKPNTQIDAAYGAVTSNNSPDHDHHVSVRSLGVANSGMSELTALSNPQGTCGLSTVFGIARDTFGNQIEYSGGTVLMSLLAGSANFGQAVSVTDFYNGTYMGQYLPTASGTDQITGSFAINCYLDGKMVPDTSSSTFYSVKNNADPDCASYALSRTCDGGVLSGDPSYQYSTCSIAADRDCYLDGVTVAHGASRDFFTISNGGCSCDSFGGDEYRDCDLAKKSRTCFNGVLSGDVDAVYANCATDTSLCGSVCMETCDYSDFIPDGPPESGATCSDGIDNDCDGKIDEMDEDCPCVDNDGDGYGNRGVNCTYQTFDCDDNNANINPGKVESIANGNCNDGIDNDCDGYIDNDPECLACKDLDRDGYGNPATNCANPQVDCNDANSAINPGAVESSAMGNCNDGIDNDCDGLIDSDPECNLGSAPASCLLGSYYGDCYGGLANCYNETHIGNTSCSGSDRLLTCSVNHVFKYFYFDENTCSNGCCGTYPNSTCCP